MWSLRPTFFGKIVDMFVPILVVRYVTNTKEGTVTDWLSLCVEMQHYRSMETRKTRPPCEKLKHLGEQNATKQEF